MNRSELRIGNLLHTSIYQDTEEAKEDLGNEYSEEKEWIVDTVEGVCHPNEDYLYWGSNGSEEGTYRTKGIEITKEWLLKLGFLETIAKTFKVTTETGDINVHLNPIHVQIQFDFSKGCISRSLEHITELHQIQNLYQALTGEELTYEHSNS